MDNNKKEIEHNKLDQSLFNNDEEYKEYLAFIQRAEEMELNFYKRQKRMRIFGIILIGYMASLVVVGVLSFILPSWKFYTDTYFTICNFLSMALCGWSFITLRKVKKSNTFKDFSLNIFIVVSILALILNAIIILNNLIFHWY